MSDAFTDVAKMKKNQRRNQGSRRTNRGNDIGKWTQTAKE